MAMFSGRSDGDTLLVQRRKGWRAALLASFLISIVYLVMVLDLIVSGHFGKYFWGQLIEFIYLFILVFQIYRIYSGIKVYRSGIELRSEEGKQVFPWAQVRGARTIVTGPTFGLRGVEILVSGPTGEVASKPIGQEIVEPEKLIAAIEEGRRRWGDLSRPAPA